MKTKKTKTSQKQKDENLNSKNSKAIDKTAKLGSPTNSMFKGFADPEKARELLNGKTPNTYGTLDEVVYSDKLNGMTRFDLMEECSKRGIVPNQDEKRMKSNLIRAFREFVAIATRGVVKPVQKLDNHDEQTRRYIQTILG